MCTNYFGFVWFCYIILACACCNRCSSKTGENPTLFPRSTNTARLPGKKIRTIHWYMNTPGSDWKSESVAQGKYGKPCPPAEASASQRIRVVGFQFVFVRAHCAQQRNFLGPIENLILSLGEIWETLPTCDSVKAKRNKVRWILLFLYGLIVRTERSCALEICIYIYINVHT